jgi:YidC/Oxa1 family membrane protein insertase
VAPGASKTRWTPACLSAPRKKSAWKPWHPGLELVKDYGWLTMLAKPLYWLLDQLHKVSGNWGWSIVALVLLLKIAFYWLNAKAYRQHGQDEGHQPPHHGDARASQGQARSRCSRR